MKYYKYGKFRFCDFWASWVGIVVMLFFSIASIMMDISPIFVIAPLAYAIVLLWSILAPYSEKFIMCSNAITVLDGRKKCKITLPSELTLIVSYADICPPLAVRTAIGNQTHILKDKYAVSILKKMPLDVAIEALHRNQIRWYTNSVVQRVFDNYQYIYGFVCDQSQIDQLIANHDCLLIIPKSLQEKILVDPSVADVHIDIRS